MESVVRLLEINIQNIKNVKNGKVELLNNNIKKSLKLEAGDVLGIYGQNGSGKTAVVDTLGILKTILSGDSLEKSLKELITVEEKECILFFKFYIETLEKKYIVEYEITIEKIEEKIQISNEVIKYIQFVDGIWEKKQTLIEVPYNKEIIKPKNRFKDILANNEHKINIKVAEGIARKLNISFIFSSEANEIMRNIYDPKNDLLVILDILKKFGKMDLVIVSNKEIGMITLNLLLPLKIKRNEAAGSIPINIGQSENLIINEKIFEDVKDTIKEINIVLKTIIPELQLELFEQRRELANENEINIVAELIAVRDKKKIPLRNESEGIKRIVSILGVIIAVYHEKNICLVIDEFDSGIFEYLLGEILEILSSEIKGQLIFTSHNLRILEKINKESILFTTSNPENRYIRFKYLKPNNNLRDMYLRELIVQEQEEELYKETNTYDIRRSLYKAGELNGEKR
ncbi:AAA family ATPase [Fusobacterium ulcerans]